MNNIQLTINAEVDVVNKGDRFMYLGIQNSEYFGENHQFIKRREGVIESMKIRTSDLIINNGIISDTTGNYSSIYYYPNEMITSDREEYKRLSKLLDGGSK